MMPAAAMQQEPKAPKGSGTARAASGRTPDHQKEQKKSVREKLQNMPLAAGIAVMILLLALALPVGNFRALQNAAPKDFLRWGDVGSIIEDRMEAAGNIVMVASRAGLDAHAINAAEAAMQMLEEAKTARAVSRADQQLTSAVSELTTAELSGEEQRSMMRAADDFAEQGSFLRQEAKAYNKKALRAEEIYEGLPLRFLFDAPDVYEGV